ncbi:4a-hydroxytetrahydrobiopterin dehydratase [Candidatus Pacearchaeota archaeon]|nr:4a-hydroxytetrahydrobiopterin dehydratase [Candidatus Pacearchaeota archaeon]
MLTLSEVSEAMKELKDWSLEIDSISKVLSFGNFKESLAFVNKVGEVAERLNHHPDILISFNQVRLVVTTHDEQGLTRKDFELAKEIDKIEIKDAQI